MSIHLHITHMDICAHPFIQSPTYFPLIHLVVIHPRMSFGRQEEFKAEQQLVGRLVHKFQNSNPDVLFKVVMQRALGRHKY